MGARNVTVRGSILFALALSVALPLAAQELSPEEEAARKAADPLGDVKALMTDNTVAFGGGESGDDTTYAIQLQPVYALPTKGKLNMIARAIVPIIGVEPGVVVPPIGSEERPANGSQWGLSDVFLQYFFSPKTEAAVKWGLGPQVSLRTRSSDRTAGPGTGGGLAAVVFSGSGNWSLGALGMQHWGEDGFSLFTFQPIAIYMLPKLPGAYVGYNNAATYDWSAKESSNALTVPLGLTFGKTVVLKSSDFIDLSIGAYSLAVRPDNAPKWQLKLGCSYFFN